MQNKMNSTTTTEKSVRVSDILEQIGRLNKMISFHQNESGEASMLRQYQSLRAEFMQELETLLASFDIKIQPTAA